MANQYKTGVVTTLEQVFLSREFERAHDRQALLHDRTQGTGLQELEQVLLSDHCGGQRDRSPHVTQVAETPPAEAWSDNAVLTVLPSGLRENNRHRAIAAVSGIAAAALVVAGLASGGAQQRQGEVSAQGPRTGSHPLPGGRSGSPAGLSPGPAGAGGALAASGSSGAPHAFLTGALARAGQSGPPPAVTVEVPPGTTVTLVPSPTAPVSPSSPQSGPTGSGTVGATGSTSPTPPGTAVTTATTQVGSGVPAVAPATGALGVGTTGPLGGVGATVTGLTQGLNATTA